MSGAVRRVWPGRCWGPRACSTRSPRGCSLGGWGGCWGALAVVAVVMGRSVGLVTALLAVSRAGAAYLPVDPELPAERIAFMLADAAPSVVVADLASVAVLPGPEVLAAPVLVADDPGVAEELAADGDGDGDEPGRAGRVVLPWQAAYVIYTSGSTGVP